MTTTPTSLDVFQSAIKPSLTNLIETQDWLTALVGSQNLDVYVRSIRDSSTELLLAEYGYKYNDTYIPIIRIEDGGMASGKAFHRRKSTLDFLRSYLLVIQDVDCIGKAHLDYKLRYNPQIINEVGSTFLGYNFHQNLN